MIQIFYMWNLFCNIGGGDVIFLGGEGIEHKAKGELFTFPKWGFSDGVKIKKIILIKVSNYYDLIL